MSILKTANPTVTYSLRLPHEARLEQLLRTMHTTLQLRAEATGPWTVIVTIKYQHRTKSGATDLFTTTLPGPTCEGQEPGQQKGCIPVSSKCIYPF